MRPFAISPYLLKEYRNRWFIIYYDYERNGICNYALDRIVFIEPYVDKPFVENTFFDPEHYFDNIVGVTKDLKSQAQMAKLKVDAN